MKIVTYVDDEILREKINMPYPCVVIESGDIEGALPLTLNSIVEGDVSVLFRWEGKLNATSKKISRSALELRKLSLVFEFDLHLSENKVYKIKSPKDILEVEEWI